ncbi:Pirin-related protein [Sphaerochaeta pleomorpha str. Grapes]|uniref:Pirin-related protein n=1 Tax=Sphaerochaeta pleomorpha (strain ATCC BAA-1885 / DSM 22778 / Grapes) TaxID=158190 RepID=G8QRZ9_SPHPG|nr:pirin family protein [Sphaerochaeta pleomorpha]AEV29997.1 Pirin-related protein [Sphaerochaeta pleomorpha str. Grapes]
MTVRPIKRITGGSVSYDGAGVKLVRIFGYNDVTDFDPFLLLDAFDSTDSADYIKGFPWHPHRGIETVTYLISGKIEHGDSLKNSGTINDGCCQWMTAGNGIIHQEMPKPCPRMLGTQLWINIAQKDKMTEPAYRDIRSEQIPVHLDEIAEVKILSGTYKGISGPLQGDYVKTTYLDVRLEANKLWSCNVAPANTVFCYILEGSALFGESPREEIGSHRAVLFGEGDTIQATSGDQGVRFLLIGGQPLHEPIAWSGPIVMNTQEELDLAQQELQRGTFIKHAR